MKNTLFIVGLSAAVSLSTMSAGFAQKEDGAKGEAKKGDSAAEGSGERGEGRRGRGERGEGRGGRDFFAQLDTDKNGKISKAEFDKSPMAERAGKERMDAMFKRMDKNEDGEIDETERAQGARPGGPDRGARIMALDTDKDEKVSKKEYLASERAKEAGEEEAGKMFARMDRNGDGFITREDMQARRPGGGAGRPEGRGPRDGSGPGGGAKPADGDKPKRPEID